MLSALLKPDKIRDYTTEIFRQVTSFSVTAISSVNTKHKEGKVRARKDIRAQAKGWPLKGKGWLGCKKMRWKLAVENCGGRGKRENKEGTNEAGKMRVWMRSGYNALDETKNEMIKEKLINSILSLS